MYKKYTINMYIKYVYKYYILSFKSEKKKEYSISNKFYNE